jgi:DNA polymerase theta
MSEFSQSFVISDSILIKLQNQGEKEKSSTPKRILRRSKTDIDVVKDTSSEIIDDSPNAKTDVTNNPNHQRTIRERFKNISTQSKRKVKVLRRNKTDLIAATVVPTETKAIAPVTTVVANKENENYTDFFQTFSEVRSQSQKPVPHQEPYSIDVSALMNSDFKLNVTESLSNQPDNVFNISEYFKDSFGGCYQDLEKVNSNQSKHDESIGHLETDNEFDKAICEAELNFTLSQQNEEKLPIVDVALEASCITFTSDLANDTLCPPSPASQKGFLETELQKCKEQVKNILSSQADASFLNVSNRDRALCDQSFDNTPLQSVQTNSNQPSHTTLHDTPLVLDTTKNLRLISNWGLPQTVLQEYKKKGIEEMFEWQSDCLQNTRVLFENANLVYSAPTSSGKTLVSEILMIKNTLERRKKALFILPFISVVREKTFYLQVRYFFKKKIHFFNQNHFLQDLLISSGIRVDGFYGGYQPPGGFEKTDIAICTIEKANSIVNKLLEHNKLSDIGVIVVDEIHLISDPSRGYILELLLAKVLYMCRKFDLKIQILTMSATLPNLELLKNWLAAEFYHTDYRPVELKEMIKIGDSVYDSKMQLIRKVSNTVFDGCSKLPKDPDSIGQLCVETILEGCAVIIFCPSKEWCEKLCLHIAELIYAIGKNRTVASEGIRKEIRLADIEEVKLQLKNCPTGLDSVLAKTISYGCAYHHAGLTTDERDIVESSFKSGILKVIVATSTLSSGVNLPARRVIIRTPLFGGKTMNSLTYRQMIGRAGRKGQVKSLFFCQLLALS